MFYILKDRGFKQAMSYLQERLDRTKALKQIQIAQIMYYVFAFSSVETASKTFHIKKPYPFFFIPLHLPYSILPPQLEELLIRKDFSRDGQFITDFQSVIIVTKHDYEGMLSAPHWGPHWGQLEDIETPIKRYLQETSR